MKKKISAALIAAILVLSTAGCTDSGEVQTTTAADTSVNESASDNGAGDTAADSATSVLDGSSFETWKDIDRNKIIAHVEGEDSAKFDITFGEFYSEYLYYLLSYNISDDMSAKYKEACETYREDIITYITFEHIYFRIAEELGLGESSLTEEELAEIQANVDATKESFISNYRTIVTGELGESATEEEIYNRSKEMLIADLERAELDMTVFEKWEKSSYIQNKLIEYLVKDVNITEEDVDAMFEEYVGMAKEALATSKASYESDSTLTWIYVPEGTRLADQILVAFDEETQAAIMEARQAGNDEEADKLRSEAYSGEIKEKVDNISALIESGSDFDELQETYNDDGANDPYAVIVGSEIYVPEFTNAIFSVDNIGDVAEPAVSDYGVHIIKYVGDDYVTDEDIAEIRTSMKAFLTEQEENLIQQAAYEEWLARFPYTIDYELLQITLDDETAAE